MTENLEFDHIRSVNRAVLALDDAHPAKKFLTAFMDCRSDCVGRELGQFEEPVDQAWTSMTDGKSWTFSGFAYSILSFDIELDGFLERAPSLTGSEIDATEQLPRYRSLMHECALAARQNGNTEVVDMTDQVLEMLDLWKAYLDFRRRATAQTDGGLQR
jgi:hypothetical protein